MKSFCLFAWLLFLAAPLARAELPPSAYEAMQKEAPECLDIEVLRLEVEPSAQPDQQTVLLVALVRAVQRSATSLKPNDIINIAYTITTPAPGFVGPGQVPIPREKDQTVAYLKQTESGDYAPAAGRMTYSHF